MEKLEGEKHVKYILSVEKVWTSLHLPISSLFFMNFGNKKKMIFDASVNRGKMTLNHSLWITSGLMVPTGA